MPRHDHVLLYDEDCGFCRWCLNKILLWDTHRRLKPHALRTEEARSLTSAMPDDQRLSSWHLVRPNGQVLSAGAAVPAVLALLPGGRPFAWLASKAPQTTDKIYRWVASHRDWLATFFSDPIAPIRDDS